MESNANGTPERERGLGAPDGSFDGLSDLQDNDIWTSVTLGKAHHGTFEECNVSGIMNIETLRKEAFSQGQNLSISGSAAGTKAIKNNGNTRSGRSSTRSRRRSMLTI
jgi:hypothetical protein